MPFTSAIGVALGSGKAGLTLEAQLVDTFGAAVGAAVTAGFVEIGAGFYMWTHTFTSGFRGGVKFTSGGALMAFLTINPEELSWPPGLGAAADLVGRADAAAALVGRPGPPRPLAGRTPPAPHTLTGRPPG